MNNLVEALRLRGDAGAAKAAGEQALAAARRVLGEEHPVTLMTMNNLALAPSDRAYRCGSCSVHVPDGRPRAAALRPPDRGSPCHR